MKPGDYPELSAALCDVCHLFGDREWCLATSGNFSVRAGASNCLITQSGRDKSKLTVSDLMICTLESEAVDASLTPSAETSLHTWLYRSDTTISAVLHTHSVAATVMSRRADSLLVIRGFEMQKALRGVTTHDTSISIPVFENSQDMTDLVSQMDHQLSEPADSVHGFLVRGHGLYGWGRSLAEAQQHIEGLEFLLKCAMLEGK